MKIIAIILTFNEELHLARCIDSIKFFTSKILVIDSYSTDLTAEIALQKGAIIYKRKWVNYANQFNWALTQVDPEIDWILRVDADEVVTKELANEISLKLPQVKQNIDGIYINRSIIFQSQLIRYGGLFPLKVIRIFRNGRGECENRWMDEHIKISGKTENFNGLIIDHNLNNLTWWIEKHNKYSSREAVDLLNLEYHFMTHDTVAGLKGWGEPKIKRWLKEYFYSKISLNIRSILYFIYRYIVCFGFLDGKNGFTFHFLQGFWYRYLVDAKIQEVKAYSHKNNVNIRIAISDVLNIKI
jgi:glycosyltransferase involved in cell wall biosynthesis